jgi:hypothetical protein
MTKHHIFLWSALLGVVAIVGSYGLACVFPFAALAAIAAITLPTRQAALLVGAVWAMNQIVGFALMHYAEGQDAIIWGLVIALGAFAALAAARLVRGTETQVIGLRTAAAAAAAIAAYQTVMFVGAVALDGFASSTPAIVAVIVKGDILWFAGLLALRAVLSRGLPRFFGVTMGPQTASL